jgi:hypothetical protein
MPGSGVGRGMTVAVDTDSLPEPNLCSTQGGIRVRHFWSRHRGSGPHRVPRNAAIRLAWPLSLDRLEGVDMTVHTEVTAGGGAL